MLHPDARIFSYHASKDPVPPRGTLDRFLLRTEQTGWPVAYHFFVISSNLTTINTRTIGSVLTLRRHFHLSPLDPLVRKREGSAERATCSVAQSKRAWPISPK